MFTEDYSQMVVVKDIEVYSMCEHHMLPFFGKAHVAYIPNGRITGLSKIPRVVDAFARRLQVQERLTNEIRDCIHRHPEAARRGRGDRVQPPVHANARHPEAELCHHDQCLHGHLPQRPPHARGIHQADQRALH
jgi:hypothetical protein